MSPELGTEAKESGDVVRLNIPYEITNVEEVTTDVSFYQGVRVEMVTAEAETGTIMLWKRPVVGTKSKLGAFITLLGSNTDKWLHRWVVFTHWEKNARVVLHSSAPSPLLQAATDEGADIVSAKKPKAKK
jgi:hypothetical protein